MFGSHAGARDSGTMRCLVRSLGEMTSEANVCGRLAMARVRCWPLLWALSAGCRCSAEPSGAVSSTPGAEELSCQRGSAQLTFSPNGADPAVAEPGADLGVELPFSAESGVALGVGSTFLATGLRHEARGAVALLGRIGAEDPTVELLELGRVQGNVAPPRLAVDGEDVIVALQQAAAGGHEVRVARLRGGGWDAPLEWREAVHQATDESNAFDLGAHAGRALIVWDDWVTADHHGRVVAANVSFDVAPTAKVETRAITAPGVDAEAPRVTPRPGGYWLAWLVNPDVGAGSRRVYDPGGRESDDRATASSGARWIEIVALDAAGGAEGKPRRLTPIEQRVVGYDLTGAADGSAWVVWRQDAPSPSSAGGRVFMAELRADGTEATSPVRDEDVGAGEPTFLFAGAAASPWLTFPDAQDRTLLMRVDASRAVSPPLRLGPDIGGGAALAAIGERILFAQPRGRSIELFAASCRAEVSKGGAARDAGPARENLDAVWPDASAPQPRQGGEPEQKP